MLLDLKRDGCLYHDKLTIRVHVAPFLNIVTVANLTNYMYRTSALSVSTAVLNTSIHYLTMTMCTALLVQALLMQ